MPLLASINVAFHHVQLPSQRLSANTASDKRIYVSVQVIERGSSNHHRTSLPEDQLRTENRPS